MKLNIEDLAALEPCALCAAMPGEPCAWQGGETLFPTPWVHMGRRWEVSLCDPGSEWRHDGWAPGTGDGATHRATRVQRYRVTDLAVGSGAWGSGRAHETVYRGACMGCGWLGEEVPNEDQALVDAHDHAWSGWRELPLVVVPHDRPSARWFAELAAATAAVGLDPDVWDPRIGAPVRYRGTRYSGRCYHRPDLGGWLMHLRWDAVDLGRVPGQQALFGGAR